MLRRAARSWIAILALGLPAPGCGRHPPPAAPIAGADVGARGAAALLWRYVRAIEADDPPSAYALLDETTQRGLPYPAFLMEWRDSPAERLAQAAALRRALQGGGAVRV